MGHAGCSRCLAQTSLKKSIATVLGLRVSYVVPISIAKLELSNQTKEPELWVFKLSAKLHAA